MNHITRLIERKKIKISGADTRRFSYRLWKDRQEHAIEMLIGCQVSFSEGMAKTGLSERLHRFTPTQNQLNPVIIIRFIPPDIVFTLYFLLHTFDFLFHGSSTMYAK